MFVASRRTPESNPSLIADPAWRKRHCAEIIFVRNWIWDRYGGWQCDNRQKKLLSCASFAGVKAGLFAARPFNPDTVSVLGGAMLNSLTNLEWELRALVVTADSVDVAAARLLVSVQLVYRELHGAMSEWLYRPTA